MSRAIASPTLLEGENMYLKMPDGEDLWSSRTLSRKEWRVLSWKFHEGTFDRKWLMWLVGAIGALLAVVVGGFLNSLFVAFVMFTGICALYFFIFVEGVAESFKSARHDMHHDHQIRFLEMQDGTPGFDLAQHYLSLLHRELVDPYATNVEVAQSKVNVYEVVVEWLESCWLDDHFSVQGEVHDDSIDHARFRLGATERAIDSFKRLGLPQLPAFEEFCADQLHAARRALREELKKQLKKEQCTVDEARERIDKLQIELDRVDRQTMSDQSGTN